MTEKGSDIFLKYRQNEYININKTLCKEVFIFFKILLKLNNH